MIAHCPSRQGPRTVGRPFAALLVAALALSSVGPTESVRAAASRDTTYSVVVTPGDVTLCPGESEQVTVRVSRQVTRSRGGRQTTGRPSDVRTARIQSHSLDPSIASVSPANARAVPLQFVPSPPGQRPGAPRSQHSGAWFTVTAGKLGNTVLTFKPQRLLNAPTLSSSDDLTVLGVVPVGDLGVHVSCKFKVTLQTSWTWTVEDIVRTGYFILPNVTLEPDSDGKFEVDASAANRNIRSGPCGGADTSGAADVHFSGRISPDGLLHVNVTFSQVATSGTEGCRGKSRTDTAQAQPLTIIANVATGQRRFFFQIPHNVVADGGTHVADSIIYLTVLQ